MNHDVIRGLNSNEQWTTLRIFQNDELETLFKASRNYKDNTSLNQIHVFSFALHKQLSQYAKRPAFS